MSGTFYREWKALSGRQPGFFGGEIIEVTCVIDGGRYFKCQLVQEATGN